MKLLRTVYAVGLLLAFPLIAPSSFGQSSVQRVIYLSGDKVLEGCVYKPSGNGPFPVVVFAQPTVKPAPDATPSDPFPQLGGFFNSKGYVLFVPGRFDLKGETEEAEPSENAADEKDNGSHWTINQEHHLKNLTNAVAWLKAQSFANERKVFLMASGAGSTTAMLAANKHLGLRGIVIFTPGSGAYRKQGILRPPLVSGVKNADCPVLYLQTMSDFTQRSVETLQPILQKKGAPNRVKVYGKLPRGQTPQTYALVAPHLWGADVTAFLMEIQK